MQVLLGKTHEIEHPNVGRLVRPRQYERLDETDELMDWAADNGRFSRWSEQSFVNMLERIGSREWERLLFVAVPDVVGDWAATLEEFDLWYERVAEVAPVAIVVQDGATVGDVPWDRVDSVFVGGGTEWKLSSASEAIIRESASRGLWTHVGRVNSLRRTRWARSLGADSIDGQSYVKWQKQHLPRLLQELESYGQQNLFG